MFFSRSLKFDHLSVQSPALMLTEQLPYSTRHPGGKLFAHCPSATVNLQILLFFVVCATNREIKINKIGGSNEPRRRGGGRRRLAAERGIFVRPRWSRRTAVICFARLRFTADRRFVSNDPPPSIFLYDSHTFCSPLPVCARNPTFSNSCHESFALHRPSTSTWLTFRCVWPPKSGNN